MNPYTPWNNETPAQRRAAADRYPREDYPHRNALLRGAYPLHSLCLMDGRLEMLGLWRAACGAGQLAVWNAIAEIVYRQIPEDEVLDTVARRMAYLADWEWVPAERGEEKGVAA